jgi:4-hydroxy-tetrahydrodipicolinate synthase
MKRMSEVHTALIMPFKNGKIDYANLEKLISFQHENGVDGIILHGTTGEAPTITHEEFVESSHQVLEKWKGKLHITIGISQGSTAEVLHKQNSLKIQPNFFLVTPPAYSKPSQEGIFRHFQAISQNSKTPIILYNVPGRTISDVQPQTLLRIASSCKNVVAIKDATGSFTRFSDQQFALRDFPREFKFFTGDDQTTPHFLLSGGNGVVSVVSNIIPSEFKEIVELAGNGHLAECMPKYLKYFNLIRLLFVESSPMPVKYVMHKMGFCELEFRLPMCEPSSNLMNEIDAELVKLGLIK